MKKKPYLLSDIDGVKFYFRSSDIFRVFSKIILKNIKKYNVRFDQILDNLNPTESSIDLIEKLNRVFVDSNIEGFEYGFNSLHNMKYVEVYAVQNDSENKHFQRFFSKKADVSFVGDFLNFRSKLELSSSADEDIERMLMINTRTLINGVDMTYLFLRFTFMNPFLSSYDLSNFVYCIDELNNIQIYIPRSFVDVPIDDLTSDVVKFDGSDEFYWDLEDSKMYPIKQTINFLLNDMDLDNPTSLVMKSKELNFSKMCNLLTPLFKFEDNKWTYLF